MSIKTQEEFEGLKAAGVLAHQVLEAMKKQVCPGISTRELDAIGEQVMREHSGQSAPRLVYGFPGANCISINEEVVHGIPADRQLQDGDIVKLDVTVERMASWRTRLFQFRWALSRWNDCA